jgi:hypothetical protein
MEIRAAVLEKPLDVTGVELAGSRPGEVHGFEPMERQDGIRRGITV